MARRNAKPAGDRQQEAAGPAASNSEIRLGPLAGALGFHLRLAQDASFRAFARDSGQKHIKPGRFAALVVIHHNPGISQTALSRAIVRDKSTVTPLIQELRRRGLVRRLQSAADRRSVTLTLTAAGEAMLNDLLVHAQEHDRLLDEIAGDGKAEFIRMLRKVADSLG